MPVYWQPSFGGSNWDGNYMKMIRLIPFVAITALAIYFLTISSCTKEYSCESCFVSDTMTTIDTTPSRDTTNRGDTAKIDSTIKFPLCSSCSNDSAYSLNQWRFRNYQSLVCGNIYDARVDSAYLDSGYDVTIRGFQDCVSDTQFVVTGIFPAKTFDADRTNVKASFSNFLFYAPNNVILAVAGGTNGTPLTMNMVLDSFNHATGVASFKFFGYAYTNKGGSSYLIGDRSYVREGRVRAKIR